MNKPTPVKINIEYVATFYDVYHQKNLSESKIKEIIEDKLGINDIKINIDNYDTTY